MFKHLKYQNISASQLIHELAPKPVQHTYKAYVPQPLRDIFNVGFVLNTNTPSGRDDSLWHCMLFSMYPPYQSENWSNKKALAQKLKEEIDHQALKLYLPSDVVRRNTTLNPDSYKKNQHALLYSISKLLQIHIVVYEKKLTLVTHHYFPTPTYERQLPTLFLLSDQGWYSVIMINDEVIHSLNSIPNQVIKQHMSQHNKILESFARERRTNVQESDVEFYASLKQLDPDSYRLTKVIDKMSKLKLSELKQMASDQGINVNRIPGRLTKAKILDALNQK